MITRASILVDTSVFKAVLDKTDDKHERGVKLWGRVMEAKETKVVTNFILDETYTLLTSRASRKLALDLHDLISENPAVFVVERVGLMDEGEAWKWFEKYSWKELSYTDCTSFVVMKRLGLRKFAAFDEHFEMVGFERVKGARQDL